MYCDMHFIYGMSLTKRNPLNTKTERFSTPKTYVRTTAMENRFYDLNTYFKNIFGHRVHKITVDAGFSCPNRDGTLSADGCIYCNASGSGTGFFQKGISVRDQILNARQYVIKRYKAKNSLRTFKLLPTPTRRSKSLNNGMTRPLGCRMWWVFPSAPGRTVWMKANCHCYRIMQKTV